MEFVKLSAMYSLEEPLGPDFLEFCFLTLSMYSFQIEYFASSLVPVFQLALVYPSHTELGLQWHEVFPHMEGL